MPSSFAETAAGTAPPSERSDSTGRQARPAARALSRVDSCRRIALWGVLPQEITGSGATVAAGIRSTRARRVRLGAVLRGGRAGHAAGETAGVGQSRGSATAARRQHRRARRERSDPAVAGSRLARQRAEARVQLGGIGERGAAEAVGGVIGAADAKP